MLAILALALAGGLVLNVMPCVLPVLALKAFHVVEHANQAPARRRAHGIAYTAGTVSLFVALGLVVVSLKTAGKQLGWGVQFQHPPFVAAMTAIVFVFALNALGVFEILVSTQSQGDEDSVLGSLANGWFAAIMSTPCSAPFVGSAAAFAFAASTSPLETLLVFATIGLGLALPYLALTMIPGLGRMLPRPGAWMENVKQLMGFALLGTSIWLYRTFQKQVTPEAANWFLFFLLAVALAFWTAHKFGSLDRTPLRRWLVRVGALAGVIAAFEGMVSFERAASASSALAGSASSDGAPGEAPLGDGVVLDGHIKWAPYDAARVAREHRHKRPVFLDFTAEWCASCKANERAFIETDTVRTAFQRTKIVAMKVDMTSENEELEALLRKFYEGHLDRNGIPAYVVFYPDGSYDLMPVIITADMVANQLDASSKKFPPAQFSMN